MNNEAEYSVSADESSYVCVAQEVRMEVRIEAPKNYAAA